jgi:hypothetical protein
VIARALQYLRLPQLVDAAVAHMRPISRAFLHQAHRASGARPRFDAEADSELHHFLVRPS